MLLSGQLNTNQGGMMTDLIVLASANAGNTVKIRDILFELKQQQLIQVADAASAVRKTDGKIKVQHEVRLIESSADSSLNQAMLLNFVLWLSWQEITAGAGSSPALYLRDYIGVDDKFVKEVNKLMELSQLILLLLAARFPEDKVMDQLQEFEVTCLKRSLSAQDEAILQETFGLPKPL